MNRKRYKNIFSIVSFKLLLGVLLVVINLLTINAQSYHIEWGAYQKMTTRDFYDGILPHDSNGFFILRSRYNALNDRTVFLDYYPFGTLERSTGSALAYPDSYKEAGLPNKLLFEDLFRLGSHLVLLMTSYNSEKDRHSAYARYIDYEGKPTGSIIELSNLKAERKFNQGEFRFATSPNRAYLLTYSHKPYDQYNDEKIGFTVVDTLCQTVWSNEYILPYKTKDFIPIDYRIDNNGTVYILSKVFLNKEQERQKKVRGSNFYFTLLRFMPEDEPNHFHEYIIKLGDKYPVNCSFRFDEDNNLNVIGYYANDRDLRNVTGLYFYTQDVDSLQPEKITLHTLPVGFIGDFETDSPLQFGEEGEPVLDNTHFLKFEDGSRILITEHRLVTETCFTDFRTALITCNYNYYYNDLYVIKIGPDDQVQWKIKINKRQVTHNDGGVYASFTFAMIKDKILLLYNDHPKNFALKGDRGLMYMSDPQKSSVALVEISMQGQVSKSELFSNERRKTWFRPRFAFQPDDSSLIFFTSRLRQHAIGRLVLNR